MTTCLSELHLDINTGEAYLPRWFHFLIREQFSLGRFTFLKGATLKNDEI